MNRMLLAALTLSLVSTFASAHVFSEIDTNKDGSIDDKEFKAHDMKMHEEHMKMHEAHMQAHEQHMKEHEGMEGGMGMDHSGKDSKNNMSQ